MKSDCPRTHEPRISRAVTQPALISLVCAALTGAIEASERATLELQGKVTSEAFNPHTGMTIQLLSYDYIIHLAGDKWRITTVDTEAAQGTSTNAARMEISFAGRDLYGLVHFPQCLLTEFESKDKVDYPVEVGQVNEADYPVTADPIQKMLWLAYCSRLYLSNLAGRPMPSLLDLTFAKEGPKMRLNYEGTAKRINTARWYCRIHKSVLPSIESRTL